MNILITGTSSGLGCGLANYYLEKGHTVFGISRRSNTFLNEYDNFKFLSQDLLVFKETEVQVSRFLQSVRSLDLVILNAGILGEIKDLKETSLEKIRKVMNANVWSNKMLIDVLFNTVHHILQVVAISSGAAVSAARGWNAYALSKATLNMLIDLYAQEHLETHFCALAPGLVDTAMQEYISNLPDDERFGVIQFLKQARGTDHMPGPAEAAKIVAAAIDEVKQKRSGVFVDVRTLNE